MRALKSTAVGEGVLAGELLAKYYPLDPVPQQRGKFASSASGLSQGWRGRGLGAGYRRVQLTHVNVLFYRCYG